MIGHEVIASTPFNSEAPFYDEHFEDNPVTHDIRSVVWQSLLKHFHPGHHVLDLSCGTGTDAIMLAQHGIRVTGIDISSQMIEQARRKIHAAQLDHMTDLRCMSFESINQFDAVKFDGIHSNFGGLNCAGHLPEVLRNAGLLLRPHGHLIACLMNKFSIWETMSFLLKGKLSSAFRRLRDGGALIRLNETEIQVRYFSLRQLSLMMAPWFRLTGAYGLNILSPSPNSRSFISSHPWVTKKLLQIDGAIRSYSPWNAIGDHVVIEAERQAETP